MFNSQEISSTFTTSKKTVGGRASSEDASASSRPHTWRSSDELQHTYPSVLYIEYILKSSTQLLSGASYRLTEPSGVFTHTWKFRFCGCLYLHMGSTPIIARIFAWTFAGDAHSNGKPNEAMNRILTLKKNIVRVNLLKNVSIEWNYPVRRHEITDWRPHIPELEFYCNKINNLPFSFKFMNCCIYTFVEICQKKTRKVL